MTGNPAPAPGTTAACPSCGSTASSRAFAVHDGNRLTSREQFGYRRCASCKTLWLQNVPADIAAHYPDDYHDFPAGAELEAAVRAERFRLALITEHVTGGRLVEIGPSQGVFSLAASRAGFEVIALEMDAECCRHLQDTLGLRAINTADPARAIVELPASRAVVMWHVIEHVPDPDALLAAIAANLEPGGVLALATPNPLGLQARLFGGRWLHLDAPRHITLIPLPALRSMLERHGLGLEHATTVDPVGLHLNQMGWELSLVGEPRLMRDGARFAWTYRKIGAALGPIERRGLRGAAYTAIFRKAR